MPKLKLTQLLKAHLLWTRGEEGRVYNCTLLERTSSIHRIFWFFFCLGSLIIYDLGGVEVVESKDFVWVPSPRLCSILMIPLIGRHPLPILYPFIAKTDPTSLPPKKRKIPPPRKKRGSPPHRRYINFAPFTFPLSPYFIQTGIFLLLSQTLEVSKSFPLTNNTFFRSVI